MEWNNNHKRIAYLSTIIVIIVLIGAFLRMHNLGEKEYNQDEIFSIHRSSLPVQEIIKSAGNEPHPPLYYLMLHFWMGMFGDSEVATRALSLVLGIVSIFLMYYLGTLLFNRETGIIASLILSISTFHITYSQESRMYSLMAMLTLASLFFFIKMIREVSVKCTGGYLLFSMLLMYSHIYGSFIILAQNLYVVATSFHSAKKRPRPSPYLSIKKWVVIQLLLVVAFIPWFIVLIRQIIGITKGSFVNLNWLPPPTLSDISNTFSIFAYYDPLTLALFSFLSLSVFFTWKGNKNNKFRRTANIQQSDGLLLLFLWLLVPIVVPLIISKLVFPIYYPKYALSASLAFYMLSSKGISQMHDKRLKGVLLAMVIYLSATSILFNP